MKKVLLVLFALLLCLSGCSNGGEKKTKVGVIQLVKHEALDKATQGFVDALNEKFGDNIEIDVQVAAGDGATCALMASNMVAENYDLIMCNATPALQAAAQATSTTPVLGTSVTEYGVALGISNFSGTVGGNISGTSDLAPLDQQAQMFIDLLPDAKTIGLLYCTSEANSKYQIDVVEEYLKSKGLTVKVYSFPDSSTLDATVTAACDEIDALYIPTDNTCADNGPVIANAAEVKNIPIITGEKSTLESCGGLATLSIDYYDLGVTTGNMAIKILNGEADISTMPIEYFASPVKMISKAKAEKFNVTIPSDFEITD